MTCLKKIHSIFIALTSLLILNGSTEAATISQVPAQLPNFVNTAVPPLNMLLVERDNKLFFPAYNDASDLDGDGSIDIRYKPSITYLGYFDSGKCYTYGGTYFSPTSLTSTKKCSGNWSGDYLNYLTTSRADALRKVLYGGYRYVDTATQTILSRAYISTNAQTWGKEYNSLAVDGYNLSDYTPYPNPSAGNYALFANNSQGTTEATYPPLLRVLPNIANVRIFGWVSREVVEGGTTATNTSLVDIPVSPIDFAVRVEACKTGFLETNCKLYPNGQYKPTGILHDYGEGNQMYFGLMTGTYTNNLQGGALRKAMGSFATEIDPSTGIFGTKTGSTYTKGAIIGTLDGLILSPLTCGSITIPLNSTCPNAGNPLAEMMYETMRYFSGAATPTPGYISGAADTALGLSGLTSWTNPYSLTPNANATNPTYPKCSKPFETLFSDVNPSYDSDLPGSSFSNPTAVPAALQTLNVSTLGSTIWNNEIGGSASINIGEVLTNNDSAPTAKTASSFGSIRGLPDEPTRQGTYNAAAVAYYANTNPITSLGNQKVQTFSIALSSTLPRIQIPVGSGTITLVPLGKVVSTAPNYATERFSGFFIDSLYNMPGQPSDSTKNGGRAQAIFRVVYDDCTQGCDFDMDAIVLYTVAVNALGTLDVTLQTTYSAAGYESHMGYTISGTTHDGIYMEVRGGGGSTTTTNYALDTPGASFPGSCQPLGTCSGTTSQLPGMLTGSVPVKISGTATTSHTRNFTASLTNAVTNLQNPLWYAAKWGGFGDSTNTASSLPVSGQWDSNTAKTPNNYFLVTNASTLKAQLSKAFNQILQTNSSVAAPAVSQSLGTSSANSIYVNSMNVAYWSGDLTKTTITTTTTGTSFTTSSATNWVASQQMPAWGSRQIMMANSNGTGLQSFSFANLSANTLTSPQVDFIRGDTSNETSTYRKRASLIGDIVDSAPVIVSTANFVPSIAETLGGAVGDYTTFKNTQATRRGQVYVGANDGMLHAFDTSTGVEKFAFIPTAVIPNLGTLSASTYNSDPSMHRYYVDGTPVTSDVYFSGAWHTVLIGTLGGGGREIFALDVTNPDAITLLWEFTSQTNTDLGYSFSIPVIARLHSGNWGVIVGNGYSGNNGVAALFIIDVGTGGVTEIKTPIGVNNGLSSPVVLDSNSDGIADYVYAGDLLGNLWRFDLLGTSVSSFAVSFGGTPLYTATVSDTAGSAVQSITAPPVVVAHPSGVGTLVIFGTGRYFTTADKANTDLQTLYGIWDKQLSTASTPNLARASLQDQTITTQDNSATFSGVTTAIRIISNNTVDWTTKYGWYLDLSASSALLGERIVDPLVISGSVLLASTRTPSTDICSPGLIGWTYGLDPTTGGRTSFSVFNLSHNGTITSADKYGGTSVVSGFSSGAGGFTMSSSPPNGSTTGMLTNATGVSTDTYDGPLTNGRQTWRVIPSP